MSASAASQAAASRPDPIVGGARMLTFITLALTIWALLHAYVGSRILSLPAFAGSLTVVLSLAVLALAYPGIRLFGRHLGGPIVATVERLGALWLGLLFQLVVWLFLADLVTGFGVLVPALTVPARLGAVALAIAFATVGIIQARREPVVVEHDVTVSGLAPASDGTVIVHLTDLHLGAGLGADFMLRTIAAVDRLRPDIIALTGDILDAEPASLRPLLPVLRQLDAPLGVWAVTGNHEFYRGLGGCVRLLEDAGYRVLRDESAEVAPGLVLAGVDDLTARRQLGHGPGDAPLERALAAARPERAATVLLSHSPLEVERASRLGVRLMLSGHTHGGQIWPFGRLVQLVYRYLGGRYEIGGMSLIVSRGTGTWGPRMRLPGRAEIYRITLRSE